MPQGIPSWMLLLVDNIVLQAINPLSEFFSCFIFWSHSLGVQPRLTNRYSCSLSITCRLLRATKRQLSFYKNLFLSTPIRPSPLPACRRIRVDQAWPISRDSLVYVKQWNVRMLTTIMLSTNICRPTPTPYPRAICRLLLLQECLVTSRLCWRHVFAAAVFQCYSTFLVYWVNHFYFSGRPCIYFIFILQ